MTASGRFSPPCSRWTPRSRVSRTSWNRRAPPTRRAGCRSGRRSERRLLMRLQLMTWPQVEKHLKTSRGVIIPAGATEQHGPTGPIGTDAICAESLAWTVGRTANAVVAPTISYGMSLHHMKFPGSVTLRPTTLVSVVRDVILAPRTARFSPLLHPQRTRRQHREPQHRHLRGLRRGRKPL